MILARANYPVIWLTRAIQPAVIAVWLVFIIVSYYYIDQPLAMALGHIRDTSLYAVAGWVSDLGLGGTQLAIAGLLFLSAQYIWPNKRLRVFAMMLFMAVAVTGIVCDILKVCLGRARPHQWFNHELFGFYFWQFKASMWSFPSGHSTTIGAAMTAFSLQWPRCERLCILVMLSVGISRLVLTQHYLSDVLSGLLLGTWLTLVIYQQCCRFPSWRQYLNLAPSTLN